MDKVLVKISLVYNLLLSLVVIHELDLVSFVAGGALEFP